MLCLSLLFQVKLIYVLQGKKYVLFQLTKDEVVLVTSKAERADTGLYKLALRNASGVGEGTLNVTVLGK